MTATFTREDYIYYARLAEQGERYEDMIRYMKEVSRVSDNFVNCYLYPFKCAGISFKIGRTRAIERRAQSSECRIQELGGLTQNRMEDHLCYPAEGGVQGNTYCNKFARALASST